MGSLAPSRFALWREEERGDRGREGERGRKGKREGREREKEGKERRRDGGRKREEEEEESETAQDSIFSCTQYENMQNRNPVTVVSVLKPFCFLKKKKKMVSQWCACKVTRLYIMTPQWCACKVTRLYNMTPSNEIPKQEIMCSWNKTG